MAENVVILSILVACIAILAEFYMLFFASMFVLFIALVALGIKVGDKVDVSHMPRSLKNGL